MKKHVLFVVFSLVFLLYVLLAYIIGENIFSNWEMTKKDSSRLFVSVFSLVIAGIVLVMIIWLFFSQLKIDKEMSQP